MPDISEATSPVYKTTKQKIAEANLAKEQAANLPKEFGIAPQDLWYVLVLIAVGTMYLAGRKAWKGETDPETKLSEGQPVKKEVGAEGLGKELVSMTKRSWPAMLLEIGPIVLFIAIAVVPAVIETARWGSLQVESIWIVALALPWAALPFVTSPVSTPGVDPQKRFAVGALCVVLLAISLIWVNPFERSSSPNGLVVVFVLIVAATAIYLRLGWKKPIPLFRIFHTKQESEVGTSDA